MARETYIVKKLPNGNIDVVPKDQVQAWTAKHYPDRLKGTPFKFSKVTRGSWVWIDGKLVPKHLARRSSGSGQGLQIIKDSEPFQNIAIDNGYIGGRRQRRDMIKAHNLIEVGNEAPVNRKEHIQFNPREFANDYKQACRQHGMDVL